MKQKWLFLQTYLWRGFDFDFPNFLICFDETEVTEAEAAEAPKLESSAEISS